MEDALILDEIITCNDLMARWSVSHNRLVKIISNEKIKEYSVVSTRINRNKKIYICRERHKIKFSPLWVTRDIQSSVFDIRDIKKYELKFPIILLPEAEGEPSERKAEEDVIIIGEYSEPIVNKLNSLRLEIIDNINNLKTREEKINYISAQFRALEKIFMETHEINFSARQRLIDSEILEREHAVAISKRNEMAGHLSKAVGEINYFKGELASANKQIADLKEQLAKLQFQQGQKTTPEQKIAAWESILPQLSGAQLKAAMLAIEKWRGKSHQQAFRDAFPKESSRNATDYVSKAKATAETIAAEHGLIMPTWKHDLQ